MPDETLAEDLRLAVEAAQAGGDLARTHFQTDFKCWDKAKGDPVSEIDLAVNTLIEKTLRPPRPGYGWLSEETRDNADRLVKDRVWVVDPIDGTRAYIKGRPEYCVSIACVEEGRPILGVLYDPSADETYCAVAGGGASLNGAPLKVSGQTDALSARLVMAEEMATHRLWPKPWTPTALTRPNSMALRIAWVANGRYDITMALSAKQDWDIAAADLILSEAGGHMTNEVGGALTYNRQDTSHPFIVGAAPGVSALACTQLRGLIEAYRAEQAERAG